jgi:aminoglycoside/choline kinase family phosphotransferase
VKATWAKTYPTPAAAESAIHHHAWISDVGQLPVPSLLRHDDHTLVFAHVSGRHADPADLTAVARTLAQFHAAALQHLAGARTNEPHTTSRGQVIAGFAGHREQRLLDLLAAPSPPDTPLTGEHVATWMAHAADLLPAVYKDANIRNFLITPAVIAVDFDTLTLAPLGYDLAKLVVSATMTYGPLDPSLTEAALTCYNSLLTDAGLPGCTITEFAAWTEMHRILTSPYQGHNGYRSTWEPTQCPPGHGLPPREPRGT